MGPVYDALPKRDMKFHHAVSIDARKDKRIWSEACVKERAFQWQAKSPAHYAEARGGNDLRQIQQLHAKLEQESGDYLWVTAPGPDAPAPVDPALQPQTSAMAELAMGVPTEETAFLRRRSGMGGPPRVARTEQALTLMPWQHAVTDPCFVPHDALSQWMQRVQVQQMPADPERVPRVPATISGGHAGSVAAWRRNEVPLSQWELSARADALRSASQLVESVAAERSKAQLGVLLKATEKASRGKARWQDR